MTEPTSTATGAAAGALSAIPAIWLGAQTDALLVGLFAAMLVTAQIRTIDSVRVAAATAFFSALAAGYGSPLLVVLGAAAMPSVARIDPSSLRLLSAFAIGALMPTLWPLIQRRAADRLAGGHENE
ncbi:hypothetical protein [Methyloversatilis sp.]|uniref:hypothetical protein n=1 Tax=Methyloversatilis sp. TaxID=2569862 RepID=UPI0035B3F775